MTRALAIITAALLSGAAHAAQCDGDGPDLKEPADAPFSGSITVWYKLDP